ncbi:hypothetical protein [Mycobacterium sp.]|uniref:hypothetical protein n=1 Tax=Mycobacterium sp. TaxID=1785 RepID=UPI003BB01945
MKKFARFAAGTAIAAGLGLAGLAGSSDAQAQPGPLPQWCPGEFWDPGWGDNWDNRGCHDNFRAGGPGWDRGGPGWDNHGGPGWDRGGPGWDNHGGPNWNNGGGPHGPEGHR